MEAYAAVSQKFRDLLDGFTPLVEPISIDEAFLDVSGTERLHGPAPEVARAVKERVQRELVLTASVGVAAVKLVAKIASDLGKPDGLVVVPPRGDARVPRAAAGRAALRRRAQDGARRCAGSASRRSGRWRAIRRRRWRRAWAPRTPRRCRRWRAARTRARSSPIARRCRSAPRRRSRRISLDGPLLRRRVTAQAERVAERLRRTAQVTSCVVLKLKDPAFHVTTRRRTLPAPTSDGRVIAKVALELLDAAKVRAPGVRLSGVAATTIAPADAPRQLTLDEPARARGERLGETLDKIRDRFGRDAVAPRRAHLRRRLRRPWQTTRKRATRARSSRRRPTSPPRASRPRPTATPRSSAASS